MSYAARSQIIFLSFLSTMRLYLPPQALFSGYSAHVHGAHNNRLESSKMRNKYCLGSVVLLGILWSQQHKVWTSKLSVIVLYSLLRHIGNSCPTVMEWDSQFRHGLLAFNVSSAFIDISGSMDKLSKRAAGSKKAINNHSLPGWPPTEVWRHYIRLSKKAEVFFTVTANLPAETRTC